MHCEKKNSNATNTHTNAAALNLLAKSAEKHKATILAARTHNVIAQLTTFGKRLAEFGEDMLRAAERLDALIDSYPVRGLKGAVGTQLDQLTLFGGDAKKALALDEKVRKHLGIPLPCKIPAAPSPIDLPDTTDSQKQLCPALLSARNSGTE